MVTVKLDVGENDLWGAGRAADFLGVSVTRMRTLPVTCVWTTGGHRRYRVRDLMAYKEWVESAPGRKN